MSKKNKTDILKTIVIILICISFILASFLVGSIYYKYIGQEKPITKIKITESDLLNSTTKINLADTIIIGNTNAKNKVIWFVDYESPYAKKYYNLIYKKTKKNFIDKNNTVFYIKNFPQENIHKNSVNTSKIVICAYNQNKTDEIFEEIFNNNINSTKNIIEKFNINQTEFNNCLISEKTENIIQKEAKEAYNLKIKTMPTFIVNDKKIEGVEPYFVWKKILSSK